MKINRSIIGLMGMAALAMTTAQTALAATNGFIVPTFRGSGSTAYGYWENFTNAYGAGNLPDQTNSTVNATLTQTDANAFLTGGSNIYNFSNSAFVLTDTAPYTLGTVVLQTSTLGSELDYNSVSLVYSNGSGIHTLAPIYRYESSRASGQGFSVSSVWQWNLTGLSIVKYSIVFNAGGPSCSFDSLVLDTAAQYDRAFLAQPFVLNSVAANLVRWNYPFNGSPANRTAASAYGALGSTPDFDSRDAQILLGWTTTNRIPAGQGAQNYLIRRARVTMTISSGNQYVYTGKQRDYRSYFPANDPRHVAATSTSSPIEMFGAGFRGIYATTPYPQDGPWGSSPNNFYASRYAYAAGFNTNGVLVDVSNSVGDDGTNEIANPFEVAPFAVGQSTNVAEGQLMPVDSPLVFELNLNDPLIYSYVQAGLNSGTLNLMAASLATASFSGPQTFASFYTIFNATATATQVPILDLEGEIVRNNADNDADGISDDWENFYFGSLINNATNSFANDGFSNFAKYRGGMDPRSATNDLRILSIERKKNTTELHFVPAPSRHYSILSSDDAQHWQTNTNPSLTYSSAWLAKTGTNVTYPAPVYSVWRDTNATTQRFYRIGVQ